MNNEITPADSVCPIYLEPISDADLQQINNEIDQKKQAAAAKEATRAAALAKLGLTADEIAALFG